MPETLDNHYCNGKKNHEKIIEIPTKEILILDPCYLRSLETLQSHAYEQLNVKTGKWYVYYSEDCPNMDALIKLGDDDIDSDNEGDVYDNMPQCTRIFIHRSYRKEKLPINGFVFRKSPCVDSGMMSVNLYNEDHDSYDQLYEYGDFGGDIGNNLYTYKDGKKIVCFVLQV